jgi:polyphosphate kinase
MKSSPEASLFINRELSWLAFNERVLEEADDQTVPLFERLKFAAIVAANLDEFFMVRVAGLKRAVETGDEAPDLTGLDPTEQVGKVRERSRALIEAVYRLTMGTLLPALARENVRVLDWASLRPEQQSAATAFFRDAVMPILTPLAIDASRPFPLLSSLTLNLAILLEPVSPDETTRLAIVQVPSGLARLVRIVGAPGLSFILLEDVVRACLQRLFPGQPIREARCVRLSRDAELELDDEGGHTHLEAVERQVRQRRRSDVVRLDVEAGASAELVDLLAGRLDIEADDVYRIPGPLDLRLFWEVCDLPGFEGLREPAFSSTNLLSGEERDLFTVLDQQDVLLHHPYESFDPVLALVAQAAEDPDVLAIKQTLYRVSAGSTITACLQRAAERNKQVTVLVELTARFDEERNIRWARSLEEAGAHVIYGVRSYKTHAKMCLIVRRTPQGLRRYLHLGTGNYNERTARLYTDFSLMSSAPTLCEDASSIFNALTGYSDPPHLKRLSMAPTGLRQRFLKLIRHEQQLAEAGQPAAIAAKMNSLVDAEIIEALYSASRAGVRIRLNVRGICALRPGVTGSSETIDVISIVDRFLEHSRIYHFHNAGDDEVYLSSADWMSRNLDRQIELLFPVYAADHKKIILTVLEAMFRDTTKARRLHADGTYRRVRPAPGERPFRVQQHLLDEARRTIQAGQDRAEVALRPR